MRLCACVRVRARVCVFNQSGKSDQNPYQVNSNVAYLFVFHSFRNSIREVSMIQGVVPLWIPLNMDKPPLCNLSSLGACVCVYMYAVGMPVCVYVSCVCVYRVCVHTRV